MTTEVLTAQETGAEKYSRQRELELEAIGVTQLEYFSNLRRLKKNGHGSNTGTGRDFIYSIVTPLHERILAEIERHRTGRLALCTRFIAQLPADITAFITAKNLIDGALAGDNLAKRANMLGDDLLDQFNANSLKEYESGAFEAMERRMRRAPSEFQKKKVKKSFLERWYKDQINPQTLSYKEKVKAGLMLLHMASQVSAKWIERIPFKPASKRHTSHRLQITLEFMEESNRREELRSLFAPQYPPSIVPPVDWKGISGGVYQTAELRKRTRFIRSWNRSYLRQMEERKGEYPQMFAAVNRAQRTAWRVNQNLCEVVKECTRLGGGKKWALPIIDTAELPSLRKLSPNTAAFQQAQKLRSEMISRYSHLQGVLTTAEKYYYEDELYFGYAVDTRGRGYPVYGGRFLSPQGDDISKAMLEFAHGEPLGSSEGIDWLLYGAASVYGIDKVSREERIVWAEEHAAIMAECAADPYRSENRNFWTGADKPWQFLAFCFEVAGALENGEEHICHISIPQDGCQNALQHVAGMLKDRDLAVRTSVVNDAESPGLHDLYQDIADRANEELAHWVESADKLGLYSDMNTADLIELEAEIGKRISDKNEKDTKYWTEMRNKVEQTLFSRLLAGQIDRSMTKRPVMTCTYDVSSFTRKEQISDAIVKNIEKLGAEYCLTEDLRWRASMFLEPIVHRATLSIIPGAFVYLDWLKDVADVVTIRPKCSRCEKCGQSLCRCICEFKTESQRKERRLSCFCKTGVSGMEWQTPLGFPVQHRKECTEVMRINTVVGSHRIQTSFTADTGRVNKKKIRSGMAANYTHSFDAAMLWMVVLRMGNAPLSLIHDSYGTLPSRSGLLAKVLREEFVRIYSTCQLTELRNYVSKSLTEAQRMLLPEVPEMGELDVRQALESEYIFS